MTATLAELRALREKMLQQPSFSYDREFHVDWFAEAAHAALAPDGVVSQLELENERLRAELRDARQQGYAQGAHDNDAFSTLILQQVAAELQAELRDWKEAAGAEADERRSAHAEVARLRADVRRLREERDRFEAAVYVDTVEVDLITGVELERLGCCCASENHTDVTKGCTDAWLKENGL